MRNLIIETIKQKKEQRNKIANSNLLLIEIEQEVDKLNSQIKALENKLVTLA